jgi:transposase
MKQVVIKRALKSLDSEWNSQFEDFFKCFGFIPGYVGLIGLKQKAKLKIR